MKKINPITNDLYKPGDIREDGMVFVMYKEYIKKDGYNRMVFASPSSIKKNRERNRINYKVLNSRILRMLRHCKDRSEKKGIDFDLTIEWFQDQFKQNRCAISGEKFNFGIKVGNTRLDPYSPSVDRIDSAKGYTQDNCRIILTCLNLALNEWGLPLYIKIAKKVLEKNK